MFPLPSLVTETRGIGDGLVLKFKTFYLKIYDDKDDTYIVQGFLYNRVNPVIIDRVKTNQFRRYAEQFTREDYLKGMLEIHRVGASQQWDEQEESWGGGR